MTLILELPKEVEKALAEDARRNGTTPEKVALDGLRRLYAAPPTVEAEKPTNPMLALFAQWDAEDATDDPEEIAHRNQEWEETKVNLEANRFNLEGRTDFRKFLAENTEDSSQEKAA